MRRQPWTFLFSPCVREVEDASLGQLAGWAVRLLHLAGMGLGPNCCAGCPEQKEKGRKRKNKRIERRFGTYVHDRLESKSKKNQHNDIDFRIYLLYKK